MAGLGDDSLELIDLLLGTAESTELFLCQSTSGVYSLGWDAAYSLLGELTGTLVLAVSEQLDDSALVGGEARESSG